ncbi:UDP-glucose 4-epimerase GalE [Streptomyces sp. NPDC088197]|uniref:UDP-glucose 4-epimerase GalE n=1 Tax=unclassified Streptomyces TaxID=2593676 RepID=UPI0033ABA658
MTWLITGGAGYIGSHVVKSMVDGGEKVVVLDDLTAGDTERLPSGVPVERASVLDRAALDRVLAAHAVEGIVHIAARKQVAESVERPLFYYRENLTGLQTLLEAAVDARVRRFVFSSSAAVYGMPDVELVTEDTPCAPMSPYGESKLAGEWLIAAAGRAHGMATASLRYFNVAGTAAPELGDRGAANIVPLVFQRISQGRRPLIFGTDYPTPDGTCVRDYVHVQDVAGAHLAAARRLTRDPEASLVLNIGSGQGVSVAEMVDLIREVSGHTELEPELAPRRAGDPARVVASAEAIGRELGWTAQYDVRAMVTSAWAAWQLQHPPR